MTAFLLKGKTMARNSSKTVTVGCKLPNGLILEVGNQSVEITGANSSRVVGGHGITYDVDAEFFEAWLKAHADRDMVKGGFVFAHEKASSAKAEAADKESNKSGLEAIKPDAPENGVKTSDD